MNYLFIEGVILRGMVWLLCVFLVSPVAARTYEEVYTAKSNQAYDNDPNVWVYTTEFAKRFAMPTEWIDDDLEGAYAVAFRVEYFDVRTYFPHKGRDVSMPVRSCFLDLYVPSDAKIPWKDNNVSGQKYLRPKSPRYLVPQTKEDRAKALAPIGIQSPGHVARRGLISFGTAKGKLGGLPLYEFEKDVYPGITYIQLVHSCTNPPDFASYIEFWEDKIWDGKNQSVLYRIDMPTSFMKRLYDNWYERTGRKSDSEWGKVLKLKSQSPSKVKKNPGNPVDYMEE